MEEVIEQYINAGRIPDLIKNLPTYNGDPSLLVSWITNTQSIITYFARIRDTPIFQVWLNQIRNKIIDKANEALISAQIGNDWELIKNTLIQRFGDSRDISSLTQTIPYLQQAGKQIPEFYQECAGLLSNIHNKISLDPENEGHVGPIMRVMNIIVRDAFIDGLDPQYASYTRNFRPESLIEAYQAAQEQFIADQRVKEKNNRVKGKQVTQERGNNIRHNFYVNRNSNMRPNNYYRFGNNGNFGGNNRPQNNYYNNNNYNRPQQNNNYNRPQQNNNYNRPQQPRPVPMDVDPSIRSRQFNRQNAGNFNHHEDYNLNNNETFDPYYEDDPSCFGIFDTIPHPRERQTPRPENSANSQDEVNFQIMGTKSSTT